jgi:L-histidine Nalpha-methyltransferase / hercynylcysteine S-oxide synthase
MYDAKVKEIPASWTEEPGQSVNGTNDNSAGHTNGNGLTNNHSNGTVSVPASFLDGKAVRTVYGPVPLKLALDWPVFASYEELAACAAWLGGRIPTFEETKSIYEHADFMRKEQAERKLGRTVPAVNGYVDLVECIKIQDR